MYCNAIPIISPLSGDFFDIIVDTTSDGIFIVNGSFIINAFTEGGHYLSSRNANKGRRANLLNFSGALHFRPCSSQGF